MQRLSTGDMYGLEHRACVCVEICLTDINALLRLLHQIRCSIQFGLRGYWQYGIQKFELVSEAAIELSFIHARGFYGDLGTKWLCRNSNNLLMDATMMICDNQSVSIGDTGKMAYKNVN